MFANLMKLRVDLIMCVDDSNLEGVLTKAFDGPGIAPASDSRMGQFLSFKRVARLKKVITQKDHHFVAVRG